MASQLKFLAVAVASASVIHYAAPEYLIRSSQGWTIAVIYLTEILMALIWHSILYPRYFSPLKNVPSPPGGYPFVGHMPEITKLPTGFPHRNWLKTVPNDGLIRYRFYLDRDRLMPTSSKALAEVLVTKSYDFEKPPFLSRRIGRLLGPLGILFAEGEVHKRQRRMLTPAFAFRHIKNLYPLFWAKSQELVKQVQSLDESGTEDIVVSAEDWFSRATLDIIGEGGLSRTFNSIKDPESELNIVYRRVFKASRGGQLLIFLSVFVPNFILKMLPVARREAVDEAADFIRAKCKGFVDEKRAELGLSNTQSSDEDKPTPKADLSPAGKDTNVDILSVALKSGGFSDEALVDQLMTFLAAGHETTATAMTWALYTLCEHPKMQERLREELQAANLPLSSSETEATITSTDIESNAYLSAFVSELLRFQPPVPFTSRVAARDTSIVGQFVPQGTTIVLVPMAINRNPEFWGPDAESFNPDRWLSTSPEGKTIYNGNGGANSNYALMTFLHGPRSCIGEKFARAEFMCLLAAWVLAFDSKATWETGGNPDDVKIDQGITRRIHGGVQIKLTPLFKSTAATTTTTNTSS